MFKAQKVSKDIIKIVHVISKGTHMHVSWYSFERTVKTDTEEDKLSLENKVFTFVFFAHKKYSRSFIKLRMNH